ncbi:MAG: PKD domain-containing protein [bacterium]
MAVYALYLSGIIFLCIFASCGRGAGKGSPPTYAQSAVAPSTVQIAVDPQVYKMLHEELMKRLGDMDKKVSAVPPGSIGKVTDLSIDADAEIIRWSYVNPGDFDQGGEVGVSDITPLAVYFGGIPGDGLGNDAAEAFLDYDGDGEVGIGDIQGIVDGWGNSVDHYLLETSLIPEGAIFEMLETPVLSGTPGWPKVFEVPFPELILDSIRVTPVDEGGKEGEPSDFFALEIPPLVFGVTPLEGDQGQSVTFQVRAAGPRPYSYVWEFGGGAYPNGAFVAEPIVVLGDSGIYQCIVSVSNEYGATSFPFELSVGPSAPRVISISPPGGNVGEKIAFHAVVSGTAPLTYAWDFGDAATPRFSSSETPLVTLAMLPGEYPIRLTVTNDLGSDTLETTISTVAIPPTIQDVSPNEGVTREQVTFSAHATGSPTLVYRWDFGGGATPNQYISGEPTATVELGVPGTYFGNLVVVNDYGLAEMPFGYVVKPKPGSWSYEFIEYGGTRNLGSFTSLEFLPDGTPAVAYQAKIDSSNFEVVYATKDASGWDIETVASGGIIGSFTSLEIDNDGTPVLAYQADGEAIMLGARYGGFWNIAELLRGDMLGNALTLEISPVGTKGIAHRKPGLPYEVRYERLESLGPESTVLSDGTSAGLGFDSLGNPLVFAYDGNSQFECFWWDGNQWGESVVDTGTNMGHGVISVALAPNGTVGLSYFAESTYDVKYAEWTGTNWAPVTVRSQGFVGQYNSLVYDENSNPWVAFNDVSNSDLVVARRVGTFWDADVVDNGGAENNRVGQYCSIAIAPNGKLAIAYYQSQRDKYGAKYAWVN